MPLFYLTLRISMEENKPEINENKKTEQEEHNEALKKCEQERAEWKDKYLHSVADFQNFKKRVAKDQANLGRLVKADLLLEILAIADNFDRALEAQGKDTESLQAWLEGFEMIRKELYKFLDKHGVREIESHDTFNPELHEAVMQVEAEEREPGSIVQVLQKGYFLNNQVLRPAKVSVAK